MLVVVFCSRGKLKLCRVANNVKVNAAYYREHVLMGIYNNEMSTMYGAETNCVELLRQDKESSHTVKSLLAFYRRMEAKTRICAIPFCDIPVKSPDASPMNYCAFRLLQHHLRKFLKQIHFHKLRTVSGRRAIVKHDGSSH